MPLDQVDVDNNSKGKEMSFLEHLEELRWHIIRSLAAIAIAATVLFIFQGWLFESVIFGPTTKDFISYRLFCEWSHALGMGDTMCIVPPEFKKQAIGFGEAFITSIRIAIIGGIVVGFPYIFWEVWRFVSPGLHEHERRAARGAVAVCSSLFFSGIFFGYFIVAPFGVRWLAGYTIPGVENIPTLSSVINYMVMFTVPSGLIFELPVVVYVLSRIGLVTPEGMRKYRKHSIVAILIIAGVLTPPDAVTQFLVGIPLYFLYEISIYISARVARQLKEKEKQESLT